MKRIVACAALLLAACSSSHPKASSSSSGTSNGGKGAAGTTGATSSPATASSSSSGAAAVVTDIGGDGFAGFADGAAGHFSASELSNPFGVAVDGAGNVYVADTGNHRIRKIDASGSVSTVAGTGEPGFLNGPASSATFRQPTGVAIDAAGNVYVADPGNDIIRKIDTTGSVTTVAGSGVYGDQDGLATEAQFANPTAVAVDGAGNLYVADTGNAAVREVDTSGNVSTLGASNYENIIGVAADGMGHVFALASHVIYEIFSDGSTTTIAGSAGYGFADGPASSAEFDGPSGIAVDAAGDLYVGDTYNDRLRRVDPSGNVTTLAGNGTAGYADGPAGADGGIAELSLPTGVAVDGASNVYFADTGNGRVRKLASNEVVSTLAGNGTHGFADGSAPTPGGAELDTPIGIVVDSSGNLFFADFANNRIRKLDTSGNISTYAGGAPGFADGPGATAQFAYPEGLAIDGANDLFVADTFNHRIRKIDSSGNVTTVAGNGTEGFADGTGAAGGTAELDAPAGVAVDSAGNLYVADTGNNRIRKIDPGGNVTTLVGTGSAAYADGSAAQAELDAPTAVVVDAAGNLYVADTGNQCIRKVDTGLNTTTFAGNSPQPYSGYELPLEGYADGAMSDGGRVELNLPYGLALDAAGNLYVADSGNSRIRKIDPGGNVTTLAGNGVAGFANGTGGPLGTAAFASPKGVAVDAMGHVYVADTGNNCLRQISP